MRSYVNGRLSAASANIEAGCKRQKDSSYFMESMEAWIFNANTDKMLDPRIVS